MTAISPDDILSIEQTAAILDVTRTTIYNMIERGDLHPIIVAERQCFDRREVERLKASRAAVNG